ncbi:aldose 1-epimerase [Paenibacillus koleovorans]|uniref:aldose 1-epimerase n=1 Tax=Paenibacillus koleovorans TaxID=121608 RepID=UPI0013E3DF77|nr:aldose 1-epimerase [Paenibacillus koleovorans]
MSRYEVNRIIVEDREVIVLQDGKTDAEALIVPALGNNAYDFRVGHAPLVFAPPNLDMLQETPSRYGVPILFPPNRTRNATFTFQGRTYRFPPNNGVDYIHGELCRRPWKVEETGASDTEGAYVISRFDYSDHADMMAYFPHALSFRFTYRLLEGCLILEGEIENGGDTSAPFSLGFHPYFPCAEDAVVVVPAVEEWPVGNDNFLPGPPQETSLCMEYAGSGVAAASIPDTVYRLFRMSGSDDNRCEIRSAGTGSSIVYETDGTFPLMVVFKPAWGAAISLEPYSAATDGFNLPYPAEVTGIRAIDAGATIRFTCTIRSGSM